MESATWWWLITGGLVIAELLTGSFYLLMLAIGAAAGAMAAHLGWGINAQLVAAIVCGTLAVVACYLVRRRLPAEAPAQRNKDVNLDVGELVEVNQWNEDGTAQVRYRGAQWTVAAHEGASEVFNGPGQYRIAEVIGSRLLVEKA